MRLAILFTLMAYFAVRLVQLSRPYLLRFQWVLGLGMVAYFALLVAVFWTYRSTGTPPEEHRALYWFVYGALGFLATVLCLLVPIDLLRLLYKSISWTSSKLFSQPLTLPIDPSRRAWIATNWGVIFLGSCAAMAVAGVRSALAGPKVVPVRIPVSVKKPGLDTLKIVQISDLHVGPTIGRAEVERVVELCNAANADIIAITGDMCDGSVSQLSHHVEPLRNLKARYGVFFVTGNHEYYSGVDAWLEEFRRMGMTILMNEHRVIRHEGASVLLAGVPDTGAEQFMGAHRSDPAAALKGAPEVDYRILLAHRPASCFAAAKAGFDLMLCGHSHGGQFFPWMLYVPFGNPYVRGLNRHEAMWVYVNSGTGYWGPPTRLGIPSEVSVINFG